MEVALFVIEFAIVPGAGEDFHPFVSEHADDGVEGFSAGLVIAHESSGPARVFPTFGGPFVKALSQEVRAVQAAYDAAGVATLSGDRRDAAVTLQGGGRWPAGAVFSVGSKQAWREGAASSWQRSKEGVVVKSGRQLLDATLDYLKAVSKNLELANERFRAQDQRRDGIGILSKSAGAGKEILRKKGATSFGIGAAPVRIIRTILRNEQTVLTVSGVAPASVSLGQVCLSLPSVIGRSGIGRVLAPASTPESRKC